MKYGLSKPNRTPWTPSNAAALISKQVEEWVDLHPDGGFLYPDGNVRFFKVVQDICKDPGMRATYEELKRRAVQEVNDWAKVMCCWNHIEACGYQEQLAAEARLKLAGMI